MSTFIAVSKIVHVPSLNVVRQSTPDTTTLGIVRASLSADGWKELYPALVRRCNSPAELQLALDTRVKEYSVLQDKCSKLTADEAEFFSGEERLELWKKIHCNELGQIIPPEYIVVDAHQRFGQLDLAQVDRAGRKGVQDNGVGSDPVKLNHRDPLPPILEIPCVVVPADVAADPIRLLEAQLGANANRDTSAQPLSDYDLLRVAVSFCEAGRADLVRKSNLFSSTAGQRARYLYQLDRMFREGNILKRVYAAENKAKKDVRNDKSVIPLNFIRHEELLHAVNRGINSKKVSVKRNGSPVELLPTQNWDTLETDHIDVIRFPSKASKAGNDALKSIQDAGGIDIVNKFAAFAMEASEINRLAVIEAINPYRDVLNALDSLKRTKPDLFLTVVKETVERIDLLLSKAPPSVVIETLPVAAVEIPVVTEASIVTQCGSIPLTADETAVAHAKFAEYGITIPAAPQDAAVKPNGKPGKPGKVKTK